MKQFILCYVASVSCLGLILHQEPKIEASIERGSEIYADFCVTCHMEDGIGVAFTFPPLANSDYLLLNRKESIKGVKYGRQGELIVNGITYNNAMAPLGLEDEEVADVMNYILNSWGNSSSKIVTVDEVEAITK